MKGRAGLGKLGTSSLAYFINIYAAVSQHGRVLYDNNICIQAYYQEVLRHQGALDDDSIDKCIYTSIPAAIDGQLLKDWGGNW